MTPFYPSGTPPVDADPACILPFEVDWGAEVIERLGWKLAATMTQSGAEQRASLRREPRVTAEFTTLIDGPGDAALLRNILLGWANRAFAVPLWWGLHLTTSPVAAGATVLPLGVDLDTLIHAGQWVLLWGSTRQCEAVQVTTVGASLTLAGPTASAWPAGTRVLPLLFAQLQDSQADAPLTGRVSRVSWVFSEIPGKGPGLPEQPATAWADVFPDGASNAEPRNHFMSLAHNWARSPNLQFTASSDLFDPGTGVQSRRLRIDRPGMAWTLDHLMATRAEKALVRKFLSAHAGPAVHFWAPTPAEDLRATGVAGTALALVDDGQASVPSTLRRGVWFPDVPAKRTVTAVTASSATLGATLTASAAQLDVGRWVAPARFGIEEFQIAHLNLDVGTISLPVVAVDVVSGAADQGEGGSGVGTGSGTWQGGGGQGVYPGAPVTGALIRFEQAPYTLSDPATTVTMVLVLDVAPVSTLAVSIRVYDGLEPPSSTAGTLEVDGARWFYPQGNLVVSVPAGATRHEFVFDHAFWREDALNTTLGLYITAPAGYVVGALQTTRSDYIA